MDVVLYKTEDGKLLLEVQLDRETVWLNQRQISELFDKNADTIGLHIRNIYKETELSRLGTTEKSSVVQNEGGRQVRRKVNFYNLDVIISVGYRVKSKRGTQFRQWATGVLREHLVRGFTLNEKHLREQEQKLADLRSTVGLLEKTLVNQVIGLNEAKGPLRVITDYAYALTTLDRFDHGTLTIEQTTPKTIYVLSYETATNIVNAMKSDFGDLFGLEKDQGFKSALGAIYQTFRGEELYSSVEEKAANLLYFVVKNHAFSDGNKRIGPPCSLPFWLETGRFTGTTAPNELPITLWWH